MKNTELKEKIRELENELEHQEKMFEVREMEIHETEREKRNDVVRAEEKATIRAEELQKRMDEHPYKLVSDMLKALVVKFPTLNINDLAISAGKK